jgi:uncharacterized membrane protein YheB (UPF0754 family)
MKTPITINEYHRRAYNMALVECFSLLYAEVIGSKVMNETEANRVLAYTDHAKDIFKHEMLLETSTVTQTASRINNSGSVFAKTVSALAEAIADDRKEAAKNKEVETTEIPEGLSSEEQTVIEKVFKERLTEDNIEEIRDSITSAIIYEKTKAEEIKNATDLDKARSKDGTISEAVISMTKRVPTTLLEAIYKFNMNETYKKLDETKSIESLISDNKEIITEGSHNTFAIYETISKFGFRQYEQKDINKLIMEYIK